MPDEHDNSAFLKSRALAQKGLADTRNFVGEQLTDPLNYIGAGVGKVGKLVGKGMLAAATALKGSEADAMMFGGKWIKPTVIEQLEKALKTGTSAEKLFQQTGYFKNPKGDWRRYIDDIGASINPEGIGKLKQGYAVKLSDVMTHPELYKTVPSLANTPLEATKAADIARGIQGQHRRMTDGTSQLTINPYMEDPLRALLHESQHNVQASGQVDSGTSSKKFLPKTFNSGIQNIRSLGTQNKLEIQKLIGFKGLDNLTPEEQLRYESLLRQAMDIDNAKKAAEKQLKQSFQKYHNSPGEVEARVTGNYYQQNLKDSPMHPNSVYDFEITNPDLFFNADSVFPRTIK